MLISHNLTYLCFAVKLLEYLGLWTNNNLVDIESEIAAVNGHISVLIGHESTDISCISLVVQISATH